MSVRIYGTVSGKEIKVHVGQTGQNWNAELGRASFDLSLATRTEFKFKAPSGTIKTKSATIVNPPDGESRTFTDKFGNKTSLLVQMEYKVDDAALFDEAGRWSVWIEVEGPDYDHPGASMEFTVFARGAA